MYFHGGRHWYGLAKLQGKKPRQREQCIFVVVGIGMGARYQAWRDYLMLVFPVALLHNGGV